MFHFGDFFENLKLAVKQCYQTGQFVKGQKMAKNGKLKSDNWTIFKQCENVQLELKRPGG